MKLARAEENSQFSDMVVEVLVWGLDVAGERQAGERQVVARRCW